MNLPALFEKSPPVAIEAEKAMLGSMMLGADSFDLTPDDFSQPANAAIFDAMQKIGSGDIIAVKQALLDADLLDNVGGSDYLADLHETVPSSASARHYANIIKDKANRRRIIEAAGLMLDDAYNNQDIQADELRARAEERLALIATKKQNDEPEIIENCTAAQDFWDATPAEIRHIFYSLKNPTDPGKHRIILSDTCILLMSYALAGTLAAKRVVVSNDHMNSKVEHFYPNHFVFFVNRSGDSKTGTIGTVLEFIKNFTAALPPHGQKPRIESGMATGPVLVIGECFGLHKDRIKSREVGTGIVLAQPANARKDAPERREVTHADHIRAVEEYKAELWRNRDAIQPIIYAVDELAEKLANVAKIANGSLIDIHTSGPEAMIEGKYNGIGTCYGYGACVSIWGNMQTALAAELFYNPKNAASGLQGRCLPLSNDFLPHVTLGDDTQGNQANVAAWMANDFGGFAVNEMPINFPSFDDTDLRQKKQSFHGIEFNKFHIMTQRILAPLAFWGGLDAAVAAYGPCLRLLMELYPHAFATGVGAQSESLSQSNIGRLSAVVDKRLKGKKRIETSDILIGFQSGERSSRREEVNAYMASKGWHPIPCQRRKNEIKGWSK